MNFFVDENDVLINTNDSFSSVFIFISKCHRFVLYSPKLKEVRSLQKFVGNIHSGFLTEFRHEAYIKRKTNMKNKSFQRMKKKNFFHLMWLTFQSKIQTDFFIPQHLQ